MAVSIQQLLSFMGEIVRTCLSGSCYAAASWYYPWLNMRKRIPEHQNLWIQDI